MSEKLTDIIRQELKRMDAKLQETDPNWYFAAFLIASEACGCDPTAIAEALEFDPAFVAVCADRARQNHIWDGGKIRWPDYRHPELGGTQFWMDVAVLAGHMQRDAAGGYSITDTGRKSVERMLKDAQK